MMWWNRKKIEILSPLEGYNLWAATYSQESNPIKNLSNNLVEKFLPDVQDKVVLDAGCGTGWFCSLAAKQNASKVIGIDISPAMIEIAKVQNASTEFRCGNLIDTVIDESYFDIIICALVLGHLECLTPSLKKLIKALKPGGTLIITDFHPFLTLLQSKRTFQDSASRRSFEVKHHLHLFSEYVNCFHENGISIEALEEPRFRDTPVVFGFRVKKSL